MIKQFTVISLAVAVVAGCSTTPTQSGNSGIYPIGLATDSDSLRITKGVYLGDATCCWLTDEAKFVVPASSDATEIVLKTYEPTSGPWAKSAQEIIIAQGTAMKKATRRLHTGHEVTLVPIEPSSKADGKLSLHLYMKHSFVPKAVGFNQDVRKLSLILESVSTR